MGNGAPSGVTAGNVLIDLAGGNYLLKSPLVFTTGSYSGIILAGGTLIADAPSFLGPPYNGTAFVLDFTFSSTLTLRDLIIDASHAGGCLRADTVLQSVITNVFFLHFSSFGLLGDAKAGSGHELLVSSCTFAEYNWGEPGYDDISKQSGTAIMMQSYGSPDWNGFYDSNFYNIVIRCSRAGIVNRAGANLYHGVHVYSTCVKTEGPGNVTVGFLSDAGQTRVANGYFDDSPLVAVYPAELTLSDSLFYGHSALIYAPQQANLTWAAGWLARGNLFTDTGYAQPGLYYDTSNGILSPGAWAAMVVTDNKFDNATLARATRLSTGLGIGPLAGAMAAQASPGSGSTWLAYGTGTVDLRGQLLLHIGDRNASDTRGQGQGLFDWRVALGEDMLARIVMPDVWRPETSGNADLTGPSPRGVGSWHPPPQPVAVRCSAQGCTDGRPSSHSTRYSAPGPRLAAPLTPVQAAFGGLLASVSGSAVTTAASCTGPGGTVAPADTSVTWSAAPHATASGPQAGLIDVTVRVTIECGDQGTTSASWRGAVSLQVDQSPPW